MKANKIVVAINFEEETHKPLMHLKDMAFTAESEIHLVHVIPVSLYARGMEFTTKPYPSPEERPEIEESIIKKLKKVKAELLPDHNNVVYKCLFDANEKACFTDYVEQVKADLVVIATRGKHGFKNLFDSSFAQHQLKYSPTNVLVLR